jgi:hypothetical protein
LAEVRPHRARRVKARRCARGDLTPEKRHASTTSAG